VFEGDWGLPAQRPSWNYKKAEGGGIVLDMLCHWRYVLDHTFGSVKAVSCLSATHIPSRVDERGSRSRAQGARRKHWPIATPRVRLIAAPIIACLVGAAHCELAPEFDPILRAAAVTIMVMLPDALVVAPLFEHSYAMCRCVIGTFHCDLRSRLDHRCLSLLLARLRQPCIL
jgi:hypothetical protein